MSDATHSPGPWQAGDRWSKEHVYAADGEMVADCCRGTRERGQANARLTAAAPDLLAACIKVLRKVYVGQRLNAGPEEVAALRAAVEKATGTTTG